MKNLSIWILLLVYLTASSLELLPVLKDTLAHLFWHHHHLEHVHHGDEDHAHVADEIVQLLKLNIGGTEAFSAVPDHKFSLSLHIGSVVLELASFRSISRQLVAIPAFCFNLPRGFGQGVFLPPEQA